MTRTSRRFRFDRDGEPEALLKRAGLMVKRCVPHRWSEPAHPDYRDHAHTHTRWFLLVERRRGATLEHGLTTTARARSVKSLFLCKCLTEEHGFVAHVEVDSVAPDARDLKGGRGDEAVRAGAVGEGADSARAAFDLAVQALKPVRRADAQAARPWASASPLAADIVLEFTTRCADAAASLATMVLAVPELVYP